MDEAEQKWKALRKAGEEANYHFGTMGAKLDQYFVNYHILKERGENVSHYESSLPKEVDIKTKHFAQHLANKAKEQEITPEVAEMVERFMRDVPEMVAHIRASHERFAHERAVEKAREEQGFAKAREEAMASSVVDLSQVFGERQKVNQIGEDMLKATGLGIHLAVGEKHAAAKLNDELVQQIRREYWASGGQERLRRGRTAGMKKGEHAEGTFIELAKKYGVAGSTLTHAVRRSTWVHLPRVEGEPEENLKQLSLQEKQIMKKAKALGVEPVRSELGRLALPPDVVAKLRAEAREKGVITKAAKKSAAKE